MLASISSEFEKSHQASWLGTSYVRVTRITPIFNRHQISTSNMHLHTLIWASLRRYGSQGCEPHGPVFCSFRHFALWLFSKSRDAHIVKIREPFVYHTRYNLIRNQLCGIGGGGLMTTSSYVRISSSCQVAV